ncbi:DUF2470 domain-containing protein [Streptomyces sp. NPDC092296]|uniref:DUF2470 domain-containing protein n=1 Tax=Streptomyces sp. NPDC092296 TaxID=3366012 RepID=UPI00380602A9
MPQHGKPTTAPCPAERARTLVEHASSASLEIPGLDLFARPGPPYPLTRTVLPDGDVLLLAPGDSPAARHAMHDRDGGLQAVLEVVDVAPVAMRHRIRGRAWAGGVLVPVLPADFARHAGLLARRHPAVGALGLDEAMAPPTGRSAWRLLRLEVDRIRVDDLWGTARTDAAGLAAVEADPLAPYEAELLQHLAAAHTDRLDLLGALVADRLPGPRPQAVPVALDRFGLRVRFLDEERFVDVRFDFDRVLETPEELRTAMHRILHRAVR